MISNWLNLGAEEGKGGFREGGWNWHRERFQVCLQPARGGVDGGEKSFVLQVESLRCMHDTCLFHLT